MGFIAFSMGGEAGQSNVIRLIVCDISDHAGKVYDKLRYASLTYESAHVSTHAAEPFSSQRDLRDLPEIWAGARDSYVFFQALSTSHGLQALGKRYVTG